MTNLPPQRPPVIVVATTKNVGVAILLTFLFGPLGMFYSTIVGGAVMLAISFFVAFFTFGFGLLITWPICIIWAAIAAKNYNDRILGQQSGLA